MEVLGLDANCAACKEPVDFKRAHCWSVWPDQCEADLICGSCLAVLAESTYAYLGGDLSKLKDTAKSL